MFRRKREAPPPHKMTVLVHGHPTFRVHSMALSAEFISNLRDMEQFALIREKVKAQT